MWEKNRATTECDKSIVTSDVSTAQYEDSTIKCEKKKSPKCDRITVTRDVGTVQCEDGIIECEKK